MAKLHGWRIDSAANGADSTDTGKTGPRGISAESLAALDAGQGTPFRMYDDDGELVYTGRYVGDSEGEGAFSPLDDFGEPNFGCTQIDYYRGTDLAVTRIDAFSGSPRWEAL